MVKLLALFSSLFLISCATTYDTQKSFWTGNTGFTEKQLGTDLWRIDFIGNTYTSVGKAREYMLKKAAEITVRQGKAFFTVVDEQTGKNALGNTGLFGGYSTTMNTETVSSMTVKIVSSKKGSGIFYDPKFLLKSE